MKLHNVLRTLALVACGALLMLLVDHTVFAQRAAAGSAHASGGAGHAGGGYGGYGWRGGYGYGWRGYWGGRWGWGPGWGWWGWWPMGVYLSVLPWYYATYWWDGIPYYYADNRYYIWNGDAGAYEQVQPPSGFNPQAPSEPAASTELFAYPKNGQSAAKQASDKNECRAWAASQTGATVGSGGVRQQDYLRAEAACLEGRGYSAR